MVVRPDKPPPGEQSEPPAEDYDDSLQGVLDLLVKEIDRLQTSLNAYRLGEHPRKQALIRWHVQQIDLRHDRLDEVKKMILAGNNDAEH